MGCAGYFTRGGRQTRVKLEGVRTEGAALTGVASIEARLRELDAMARERRPRAESGWGEPGGEGAGRQFRPGLDRGKG